jgi:hypothetical protein
MSQLDPLAVGRKISIWPFQSHWSLPEDGLVATIEKTSADKICLMLLKPGPRLPLQEGGRVRIQAWTREALYFWEAQILEMSDSAKQQVTISILDDGVRLERRERSA